jgi:transcription termination factor NusB
LYYEDYADDLEGETNKLLSFLNLTRSVDDEGNQVELPEFRQSDYSDYFTLEERAATSELIRRVMKNEKGIELLSRYFTEWDFQKLINQTQDII